MHSVAPLKLRFRLNMPIASGRQNGCCTELAAYRRCFSGYKVWIDYVLSLSLSAVEMKSSGRGSSLFISFHFTAFRAIQAVGSWFNYMKIKIKTIVYVIALYARCSISAGLKSEGYH